MEEKAKCVTLLPGRYMFICPCGFPYTILNITHKTGKVSTFCFSCLKQNGKHYKMDVNRELIFRHNWNNKLNCDCFTTLRLWNPIKYCVGNQFNISLKGVYKGRAKLIDVKKITLDKINDFIARLDTGYSTDECRNIIREMYKKQTHINWKTQEFAFCLLQYDKEEKEPNLFDTK